MNNIYKKKINIRSSNIYGGKSTYKTTSCSTANSANPNCSDIQKTIADDNGNVLDVSNELTC